MASSAMGAQPAKICETGPEGGSTGRAPLVVATLARGRPGLPVGRPRERGMRTTRACALVVLPGITATLAAVGLDGGTVSAATSRPSAGAGTRDPLQWPFARTSIWNTP